MTQDIADPRGLIREAYRIEGIGLADCRTIFLDWAISVPGDMAAHLGNLLGRYQPVHPDHPMTQVLQQAMQDPPPPRRQGGRRGRRGA